MPAVLFATTLEPKDGRRGELAGPLAEPAEHIRGEPGFLQYPAHRPLSGDNGPLLAIQMHASAEAYQEHNPRVRGQLPRISELPAAPRPSCPTRTGPARRRRGEGTPSRRMIMPCGVPAHLW